MKLAKKNSLNEVVRLFEEMGLARNYLMFGNGRFPK